jgi:HEAT repeat protein
MPAHADETRNLDSRVRKVLKSASSDAPGAGARAVESLVAMGPRVADELLRAGGDVADPRQQEVVARTLSRLRDARLDTYLLHVLGTARDAAARAAALRLLGDHGEVKALLALARNLGEFPPEAKDEASEAVTEMLRRHSGPEAYRSVSGLLEDVSGEGLGRLLSCIADAGSPFGLKIFEKQLGKSSARDLAVLVALSRLSSGPRDPELAMRARGLLKSPDRSIARAAVLAVGALGDSQSVEHLIAFLAGEDSGIRENALWSLRKITGLQLTTDAMLWRSWYVDERAWWSTEGRKLLSELDTNDPERVTRAILVLSQRKLYKERVAEHLERLMQHETEEVRESAEDALVRMGLREGARRGVSSALAASPTFLSEPIPGRVRTTRRSPAHGGDSSPPPKRTLLFLVASAMILWLILRITGVWSLDWLRRRFSGNAL